MKNYLHATYEEIKEDYINNFRVSREQHQLMEYLEDSTHDATSLLRDFMEYRLTHFISEDIPF